MSRNQIDLTLPIHDGMQLFPGLPTFESESSVSETTGATITRPTSMPVTGYCS